MPPANNPTSKRIVDDIESTLDDILSGSNYFYTPNKVIQTDPPYLSLIKDQTDTLIYLLCVGDETEKHFSTGGFQQCELEIFIFGSQIWEPTNYNEEDREEADEESKASMREKMKHDVRRAVNVDWNRGGLAQNTNITDLRSVYMDSSTLPQKACFEMRIVVEYKYQKLTP